LPLPTRTSRLVGQASRLSVVGQASRLSVVGQASRLSVVGQASRLSVVRQASRLPIVGCASRRNQTQNSTKKQEADSESYRPVGRAFTTSAHGSQRTSNPKCENRRMQTDSALAFGVRELAPAFASTGSFESAGKPREITGAGPGNAIGRNISWGKPAHSKRFAQFVRPRPASGFLVHWH